MTKLLDQAVAKVRELPLDEQDALAAPLLSFASSGQTEIPVDEGTLVAIREGLAQADRGEFVPDHEIEALWRRHGL